jgi:2-polyprenyl-3-methyl-5-hydroxy-6-metoxy-1,4-benzoquinol methylase
MSGPDNEQYWIDRHEKMCGQLAAVGHVAKSQAENEELYARKRQMIADLLSAIGTPDLSGKTVLDAGCGVGMVSDVLADHGARVVGLDASPVALEQAKARCPSGTFIAGSLVDFRILEAFDMIFCIDVLYHILDDENWKSVLGNFVRHLKVKRDTRHIVFIDQHKHEASRPAAHVRFRTKAMYDEALREAGERFGLSVHSDTPVGLEKYALVYEVR